GGGAGTTAFTVGAAFTYEDGQMTLNANPVIEDDGTNSWTDAYLGAFYKLNNRKLGGKVLAVAEVELQLSAPVGVVTENITRLGLRWVPTRNVAVGGSQPL
ncbi:MAG: hypothetical protein GWO08_14670, partial [Gammaproteobacteria bacterium]|nr:hypothetical protein [Gammaproteobacteria bacterium]